MPQITLVHGAIDGRGIGAHIVSMKIQVDCLNGRRGIEPRYLWLGGRRLHVAELLGRSGEPERPIFRLRVDDRREFVVSCDASTGEWQLLQVCAPQRQEVSRAMPTAPSTDASSSRGR